MKSFLSCSIVGILLGSMLIIGLDYQLKVEQENACTTDYECEVVI